MTQEITRIGDTTEFNKKKLLNVGGAANIDSDDKEEMVKAMEAWWFGAGAKIVKDSYGLEVPEGTDIKIVLDNDLGSAAALVRASYKEDAGSSTGLTGKGIDLELHISLSSSLPLDFETDKNGGVAPQYVDRVIVHEMTHAIMSQTMNFGELNTWLKEGAAEFAHGADERLKQSIDLLGGIDKVVAKIDDGTTWGGDSESYSAAYVAVRYMDKALEDAAFITDVKSKVKTEADLTNKCRTDMSNTDTGSVLGKDNGGSDDINAEDVVKEAGYACCCLRYFWGRRLIGCIN